MDLEILSVENGKVVPGISCYSIPELKEVMEAYEDNINALTYLYYFCYPKSAYANLKEDELEDVILEDYPGDYSPEDEIILAAVEKLKSLYLTPTRRFFKNSKKGLETLGEYMATTAITDGKEGNFSAFSMTLTRVGKTIKEFKELEKIYEEETGSSLRGGGDASYDEID
jgi:hypothetical protein